MRALIALILIAAGAGAALALPDRLAAVAIVPGLIASIYAFLKDE